MTLCRHSPCNPTSHCHLLYYEAARLGATFITAVIATAQCTLHLALSRHRPHLGFVRPGPTHGLHDTRLRPCREHLSWVYVLGFRHLALIIASTVKLRALPAIVPVLRVLSLFSIIFWWYRAGCFVLHVSYFTVCVPTPSSCSHCNLVSRTKIHGHHHPD